MSQVCQAEAWAELGREPKILVKTGLGVSLLELLQGIFPHPQQMQHVLGEWQQDLCHLQGGEEAATLHPARHCMVCGHSAWGPVGGRPELLGARPGLPRRVWVAAEGQA